MITVVGKYNTAKIFTDNVDDTTTSQIINLLNQSFISGSKIRIMPDAHAGKGCVVGFTMEIKNKIVPNLVGVDIGCGMDVVYFETDKLDLEKIDLFIRNKIPHGFSIHKEPLEFIKFNPERLLCYDEIPHEKIMNSIGSLGGGNHFIEINSSGYGYYLVIHSGSRNLGLQVANYYQNLATKLIKDNMDYLREYTIQMAKNQGLDIQNELDKCDFEIPPKDLCYLDGKVMKEYLHDMEICQEYASLNRQAMSLLILEYFNWDVMDEWETIHNYIDFDDMILRKGAISARKAERVIIPINMRDGSLIGYGKGNSDWNFSAPHGAGRLMSRSQAKKEINLEDFENSMKGVYSTSVNKNTLDESPMAYKPIEEILENINDTVDCIEQIKPVYNFKAF